MQQYMAQLLAAPLDGWITMSHFPANLDAQIETTTPVLMILGVCDATSQQLLSPQQQLSSDVLVN